jgi:hypothetical protein
MSLKHVFAEIEALRTAAIIRNYALGGAVGATYYVEPAATQDVDIFVAFTDDTSSTLAPLGPIYEFLIGRGATIDAGHVVISGWPVQFLPVAGALLEEALNASRDADLEGQPLRVFSAEHLAAIALDTGRAKDKIRLTQFLEWNDFDRSRFESIVQRHGLVAKWRDFRQAFGNS